MKIRSRVILSIIILCIITFVIAVALYVTLLRTNELNAREDTAERLLLSSHELSELSNDYLLFHEKRQQIQWETKYNSISALLTQLQVDRPDEQNLVDNFASNHKRLKEIFNEVRGFFETDSGSMKDGGDIGFLRVSWSRLAVQAQGMIHDASQLSLLIQTETRNVHHRITVLIMTMIGTLIVFIVVNYIFINWKLLRSVENLRKGTMIIGEGNLDYRIDDTAKDEIGDLARSFNRMSVNLINVMASKEELNREVEERKRSEETVQRSEKFLEQVLENIPNMIFVKEAENLRFVRFNRAGEDLLGYSREALLGKNDYDFFPAAQADFFTAKDRAVLTDGKLLDIPEEEIETKLKGKRILRTKKIPILNADGTAQFLLGISEDITERRQFEESQKLLSATIEQAAEAVIITDASGITQYVNPAQEILSGYGRDELIGQTPNVLNSNFHGDNFNEQIWDTIGVGKIWSGRFVNRKKDGTEYYQDATVSPVYDNAGNLSNFVVVQHDVTKQVVLQEQLFQAQKMEAIGTLTGGFAHDFRNMLQVVLGSLELIEFDKDLPEKFRTDLDRIRKAATSGAELVKGMLVFSRKTSVKLEPLNLNNLVVHVESLLTRSIPKMIKIDIVTADDLPSINGDSTQMEQILMNLAINAADAMPDGGTLTIQTLNTVLDEEFSHSYPNTRPGRYALLSVTDTGTGMNEETVRRIFEPFFTTKEKGKGTGLGLAVVYGIVEQHGARIICESQPSVGTTFRIYFPATEEVSEEQYSEKKEPPRGQGETILLVDDAPEILEMATRLLNDANYRVMAASNAKQAIELYGKHRDKIRLVLLDVIMPEIGGKQCLEALRKMDPNVKVLIATGYTKRGMTQELKDAGARDFILKPFDTPQLLEKIRKIIDEE